MMLSKKNKNTEISLSANGQSPQMTRDAMPNTDKRAIRILIILSVLAIAAIALFIFQGLTHRNFNFNFPRRVHKIEAMILVSICVGYSSVIFQTITENRILTPSVMGLDSLYLFIQSFVVFVFGAKKLVMMSDLLQFVVSGGIMILASFILYQLMFRGEGRNVYKLVLVGMIMGTFFRGISSFFQMLIDPNEFAILQGKMFATFNTVNEKLLLISAILILIALIISRKDISRFDVLGLGRDTSISLGISYNRLVRRSMLVIAVMVSISTVLVGPITFLGILLVSVAREILKTYHHRFTILGTILIGIIALPLGEFLVERVIKGTTTLSVILNFIGGIYFIFILLKESKR